MHHNDDGILVHIADVYINFSLVLWYNYENSGYNKIYPYETKVNSSISLQRDMCKLIWISHTFTQHMAWAMVYDKGTFDIYMYIM